MTQTIIETILKAVIVNNIELLNLAMTQYFKTAEGEGIKKKEFQSIKRYGEIIATLCEELP